MPIYSISIIRDEKGQTIEEQVEIDGVSRIPVAGPVYYTYLQAQLAVEGVGNIPVRARVALPGSNPSTAFARMEETVNTTGKEALAAAAQEALEQMYPGADGSSKPQIIQGG